MLNGISPIISPDLLNIMYRMGHGDEIVFADAHFPAETHAQRLARADGHSIPALLDAVLPLFPLDRYVKHAALMMTPVEGDQLDPAVERCYQEKFKAHSPHDVSIERLERFAFYDRAKTAFAIVATGDCANYSNLILKKGHAEGYSLR